MWLKTYQLVSVISMTLLSTIVLADSPPVHAVIDTTTIGAPISKNIYGQFLEHGGDIVNEGVWAEMLVDRKFYYPVTSKAPELPQVPEWRRRGPQRFWKTIGGDEFVSMDKSNPTAVITHQLSSSINKRHTDLRKQDWRCARVRPIQVASFLQVMQAVM